MRLLSLLCVTLAYGAESARRRLGGLGPFAQIHAIWPFDEQACRTSPRVAAANQSINFTTFNCIPYEESLKITEAMSFAVVDSILARLPAVGRVAIVAQVWYVAQRESISRAVRAGVALFLVESSFDLAEYGIDLTQHLVLEFWPDNSAGASSVGQELCRRVGSPQRLRVAGLYPAGGGGEWGAYSVRVDGAIAALQRCLDNRIDTRTALDIGPMITAEGWGREEAREIFESVFMTDVGIDAVITAGDNPAIGVIEAADSMLTLQDAQSLFVSGFDDDPMLEPYLQTGRAFATVNQLLDFPNFGVWHSLPDMIDVIAKRGYHTTAEVQANFPALGAGHVVHCGVLMKPSGSDVQGYLISRLLGGSYDTNVPARAPPGRGAGEAARYGATITEVSVSVQDIVIESINVPAGTFEATFWLQTWWIDKRLTWPSTLYSGSIQVMASLLWTPTLYVKNHLSERTGQNVGETLVTVNASGVARWGRKITGEFACSMSIEPYPYDVHECHLNITSDVPIEQLVLHPDPLPGEQFSSDLQSNLTGPEGYTTKLTGSTQSSIPPWRSPVRKSQSAIKVTVLIEREPSFVTTMHVMMGWLLVILCSAQYWIPRDGNTDRAGLAITTVLASTVLMTEASVSTKPTWLQYFFIVCITFQALSFLIAVVAGRRQGISAKKERKSKSARRAGQAQEGASFQQAPRLAIKRQRAGHRRLRSLSRIFSVPARVGSAGAIVLGVCEEITGRRNHDIQDLIGIRIMLPGFLLACTILPFLTTAVCSGDHCQHHPKSGANSELFIVNVICLALWCSAFLLVRVAKCMPKAQPS